MEDYRLEQTGQEVQDILNGAAMQTELAAEKLARQNADAALEQYVDGKVSDEELARQQADTALQGNIDEEETRAKAAEQANATTIETINGKIPAEASAENKLVDNASLQGGYYTKAVIDNLIQGLGQNDVIVGTLPASGVANTIYRVPGDGVYSDYMWYDGAWQLLATYSANIQGYQYIGIATPTTNPGTPSNNVFYFAHEAGTYTNFGALAVTQGINILKFDGTSWALEQLVGIDAVPTAGSVKIVQSGGVFNAIAEAGVVNISEVNKVGTTLAKYSSLSDALAAVPSAYHRGGMSIKFIQLTPATYSVVKTEGLTEQPTGTEVQEALAVSTGSYTAEQLSGITLPSAVGGSVTYWLAITADEVTTYTTWVITYASAEKQEYVQYRLMNTAWSRNVADWQGTDDLPIKGSRNLLESSVIANALNPNIPLFETGNIVAQYNGYNGNRASTSTIRTTYFIKKDLYGRIYFVNPERDALRMGVFYYDKNYNFLQYVNWEGCGNDYTLINVPNSVYIRVIVYHYPSTTMNPSIITEDVIRFVGINIDTKVEALSNLNNYNEGFVLHSGGVLQQNTSFITTPYISCTPQDTVKWYWKNLDYNPILYVFDENKNYITYFGPTAGATSRTVNLSSYSGAAYIRVSFKPSQLDAAYISINGEIVWYANNIYRGDINNVSNDVNIIKQDIQSLSETIGDVVPSLTLKNGYVQAGTGKIISSTASKVSKPFLLKEGQTISVSTDNINTSFINSTTSESIAVGSVVTPLANVRTNGYITKEYTATEDTLIVISVKGSLYEVKINNNDSLIARITNLENKVIDLENNEENNKLLLYGEKLIKRTYTGERISLFDDNSVHYERKQFSTIPFESTQNQSFAVNGEYIIFLFHNTMNAVMYRLTDNTKVCDLSFPTDSTYGSSHNNACGFGTEKYSDNSVFPIFYISQFNTGTKSYLAYDLVTNSDGTYTPKLVQIIVPSSELRNNDSFGLGPGDYCIDKDNNKLYHIGYKANQIGGNVMVSKFDMPTKEDGTDFVSSTGDTIKVVTLNISDMEDSFDIGGSLLQDNCYYKGNIIKTGSALTFIDLATKNIRSIPINIGNGFDESEGIDVYMDRLIMNYWNKQGIFEFKF